MAAIGHLTNISRLHKEHEQPATQVDLRRIVQEVQLDLAPLLAQTQGQIDLAIPAGTTRTFSEKNLRSVVYNLLSNALKSPPDRLPRVLVSCQQHETYQLLTVQDNGLGINLARSQERLFGMFQRLHTHVEGTGIGLHMVKKIIDNAGGA